MFVYIREAHPADSNWEDPELDIDDPLTQSARNEVATQCRADLSMSLPMVVDDMNDTVNQLYRAWPERIYVIDREGTIAFKGGIGPFRFSPREARDALRELVDE